MRVDRPANGGAGVGRDENGRTTFCEGGLPGELVRVELTHEKKRFARGVVSEVLEPSPDRIAPSCPTRREGCGGCDMAHASLDAQRQIKGHVVRDALIRIGRFATDQVEDTWLGFLEDDSSTRLEDSWYRTTARLAVANERLGYRRASSHDVLHPVECGVVHPLLEELVLQGRFPRAAGPEVTLRVSHATGERIVVVDGSATGVKVPGDVTVVSQTQLAAGADVSLIEDAASRSWVVSAGSFFQAGPRVASRLVDAVGKAAGDCAGQSVVDAYAGVGLFAGTVAATASELVTIEASTSSVRDAERNLADQRAAGQRVEIIGAAVEEWTATAADVVIADPARSGLAAEGVETLAATAAERFVLVSCDTGSLGRDAGLLRDAGYTLDSIRLVDAFRDTSHVEVVAGFQRT